MIKISVSIDVANLQQGEKFYIEALGCKKKKVQGDMVILSTDNCDIYLQEKVSGTKPIDGNDDIMRDYKRHWSPVHLDFLCNDVESVVLKVVELGGIHEGGESADWGAIAHCSDPFGNGFCIINE